MEHCNLHAFNSTQMQTAFLKGEMWFRMSTKSVEEDRVSTVFISIVQGSSTQLFLQMWLTLKQRIHQGRFFFKSPYCSHARRSTDEGPGKGDAAGAVRSVAVCPARRDNRGIQGDVVKEGRLPAINHRICCWLGQRVAVPFLLLQERRRWAYFLSRLL
jgi:hypothetical protein